jgi:unsaturated rhamnogalacturonyl hydrolase
MIRPTAMAGVWVSLVLISTNGALAAQPSTRPASRPAARPPNTQPVYPVPYGIPNIDKIKKTLEAVKGQIEKSSMTSLTTRPSTAASELATGRRFALITYPMGVIYSGMLSAADATGDQSFAEFDAKRFRMFAAAISKVDLSRVSRRRGDITYLLSPHTLDDCGAIGASLIQARKAGVGPDLMVAIDRIADFISHKQLRLDDGTLARPRPVRNSVWADDAYMSIPFLAQMGSLTGDRKYFDDAAMQVLHFQKYLFVPSTGLFTHHWDTVNPDDQPRYYWGRANGWIILAMADLLDVLPEDHPLRGQILRLYRAHAQALASLQAGDGLWHQMLDRTDSYTETSCSAMFTYALARGVNRGWLDVAAYGPVADAGWNGLSARIDSEGHITGTCIGTGYADDYVFYYHRPGIDDIHGYGPVLLAGSEVIRMLRNPKIWKTTSPNNPVMYRPSNGGDSDLWGVP